MTTLNDAKRAVVVVGGISAVVCASAAYYWVKSKNGNNTEENDRKNNINCSSTKLKSNNHRKNSHKLSTSSVNCCQNNNSTTEEFDPISDDQEESEANFSSSESSSVAEICNGKSRQNTMLPVTRGGRKNYRALKKTSTDSMSNSVNSSSGNRPIRLQTEAEVNATRLAAEFSSKINLSTSATSSINGQASSPDGELVTAMMMNDVDSQSPSPKGQCAESPSLASDGRSEGSQDSGKGASTALTSSVSPVEELIEIPPMYEFEVPQDIVGLIIGSKGSTIKQFTSASGAQIVIRKHFSSDKHKICTIEGSREQINKCLRLIRRKFPPSRFPDLKLTPLLPPPIVSPRTPVCDSIIRLNLPQGIKCEVVVSSLTDAGHFFLQQPTHPTFPSLARLDECMSAIYSQPFGIPGLPRPIDNGVICAAPVLGGWYRAQTIETYDDTDEALVKFVDYGGYSKIQSSDLRQIRSDLMSLPFEASECVLAHVKPAKDAETWSAEATAFFEQCTQSKLVDAMVVGYASTDNVYSVELFYTTDSQPDEPIMLNRILVDNGYAQWTDDE